MTTRQAGHTFQFEVFPSTKLYSQSKSVTANSGEKINQLIEQLGNAEAIATDHFVHFLPSLVNLYLG